MSKETFKPKLIAFQEDAFHKELSKYNHFKFNLEHAKVRWKTILGIDLSEVDLLSESAFKNIASLYAKHWESKNALELSPIKLMEAKEVDIQKLMHDLDKLRTHQQAKPNKVDFESYTKSESENERLKVAQNFIEMLPYLKTAGIQFRNATQAPIMMGITKPTINQYFVKQSIR